MSKKKKTPTNKILLRPGLIVGQLAAEDDHDFLSHAFVQLPILSELLDHDNPKSILLGRTGTGKTALLKHIGEITRRVYEVRPKDVSLSYISNSTIIKFFSELGVDLDLFFQLLWRHVIAVELIRQHYGINSESQNLSFIQKLQDTFFGDERKKAAVDYLRKWQSKFWINWDERVQEITEKFEGQLKGAAESTLPIGSAKAEALTSLSSEQKIQLVQRAQSIVNSLQIAELSRVIDLLADHAFSETDKKYYLVVDDLDEKWVDEEIRFKLIRALIETVKVFRRIANLKIIVAIRADILERVYSETRDLGFQLDKYEGYIARIIWSEKEMRDLLDQRVRYLFRKQYTKQDVKFSDVFVNNVGSIDPFEYLISRTLMRPRDLIAYVNECLSLAGGRTEVSAQIVRNAEQSYSHKRLIAIQDEWRSVHPNLPIGIQFFTNKPATIPFSEIRAREVIEDIALKINESPLRSSDEIVEAAKAVFETSSSTSVLRFARLVTSILYKVGVIGIKTDKNKPFNYCYLNAPTILEHQISEESTLRIHPMFWRALGTKLI